MIIGIDLGTTNSLAAVWRDGGPVLVPNALGATLTPSVVGVGDDGATLVGQAARDRLSTRPGRGAASFKRAMGTDHVFELAGRPFRAEELSALVLSSLKADAERFLGTPVEEAVITVPAYFSNAQRRATEAAGRLAGLRVRRLLNEPTAAAMAYGLHAGSEQRILVLDLGGGTFDVSVLELFEGVMEVRATAGDNRLGGDDFTGALMEGFMQAVGTAAGLPPLRHDGEVRGALRHAAEVAKRALSAGHEHTMTLVHDGTALSWPITREGYEARVQPLLARLRAPIERAIRDSRLSPNEIDHLVLAGGATRMPMIRRMAAQLFERLPVATVDPDQVVALGAAVQAGLVAQDAALADRVMTDVAPFTLGVETVKGRNGKTLLGGIFLPLIERNTVIPARRSTTLSTIGDYQRRITLKVFQGEGRLVRDNIYLGELDVPVPRGRAEHRRALHLRYQRPARSRRARGEHRPTPLNIDPEPARSAERARDRGPAEETRGSEGEPARAGRERGADRPRRAAILRAPGRRTRRGGGSAGALHNNPGPAGPGRDRGGAGGAGGLARRHRRLGVLSAACRARTSGPISASCPPRTRRRSGAPMQSG